MVVLILLTISSSSFLFPLPPALLVLLLLRWCKGEALLQIATTVELGRLLELLELWVSGPGLGIFVVLEASAIMGDERLVA